MSSSSSFLNGERQALFDVTIKPTFGWY